MCGKSVRVALGSRRWFICGVDGHAWCQPRTQLAPGSEMRSAKPNFSLYRRDKMDGGTGMSEASTRATLVQYIVA